LEDNSAAYQSRQLQKGSIPAEILLGYLAEVGFFYRTCRAANGIVDLKKNRLIRFYRKKTRQKFKENPELSHARALTEFALRKSNFNRWV